MNFLAVLKRKNIEFKVSPTDPAEIQVCCPFCVQRGYSPDTRYRLGLNVRKNMGHCFNCEWGSRKAVTYIAKLFNLGDVDTSDFSKEEKKVHSDVHLPEDFCRLWKKGKRPFGALYKKAFDYLINRGVSISQIENHRIGVSLIGDYAYRIVFPVYFKRKLVGLVCRDFTGQSDLRYKNSVGDKFLYNARSYPTSDTAILSEGIFDCLSIERALPTFDSIALLGHSLTPETEAYLLQKYKKLIVWSDPDVAGLMGSIKIAESFRMIGRQVEFVPPYKDKDPGDLSAPIIRTHFESTKRPYTAALALALRARMHKL